MNEPDRPVRKTLRLPTYDYAGAGAYFLTPVTHERECLFGEIVDLTMHLNELGRIVEREWLRSTEIRPGIVLDAFVVMPNHVHGVIIFPGDGLMNEQNEGTKQKFERASRSVGSFVAGFKSSVTAQVNTLRGSRGRPVWQRNYCEHIIRNETDLGRIREYIESNPAKWGEDAENPVYHASKGWITGTAGPPQRSIPRPVGDSVRRR